MTDKIQKEATPEVDKVEEAKKILQAEQQKQFQEDQIKLQKFLDDNNLTINISYQIAAVKKQNG